MVTQSPHQPSAERTWWDAVRSVPEADCDAGRAEHADPVPGADAALHAADRKSPEDAARDLADVPVSDRPDVDAGDDPAAGGIHPRSALWELHGHGFGGRRGQLGALLDDRSDGRR
jgi:hypothetical protein